MFLFWACVIIGIVLGGVSAFYNWHDIGDTILGTIFGGFCGFAAGFILSLLISIIVLGECEQKIISNNKYELIQNTNVYTTIIDGEINFAYIDENGIIVTKSVDENFNIQPTTEENSYVEIIQYEVNSDILKNITMGLADKSVTYNFYIAEAADED